jgi:hypothetical protein
VSNTSRKPDGLQTGPYSPAFYYYYDDGTFFAYDYGRNREYPFGEAAPWVGDDAARSVIDLLNPPPPPRREKTSRVGRFLRSLFISRL